MSKSMEFCPRCNALMFPNSNNPKVLACNCGYKSRKVSILKIKEKTEDLINIELINKKIETMPKTEKECPSCGHEKAFYYLAQTRGADEAETQFFECVKCAYRWREGR